MNKRLFKSVMPQGDFVYDQVGLLFGNKEMVFFDKKVLKSLHLDDFRQEWLSGAGGGTQGIMRHIVSVDYTYLIIDTPLFKRTQKEDFEILKRHLLAPDVVSIFFLDSENGLRYDFFVSWSSNNDFINEDVSVINKDGDIAISIKPRNEI